MSLPFLGSIDLASLITTAGYAGIFGIIFAESGLLIGFFLPGDSLLFTAGFLASRGVFNIWVLAPLCFAAAVLGDNFGYAFGRRLGPKIFIRERSLFFHREYIGRTQRFYERHGGKTLILARFLPGVRTFAPIFAGVGRMRYSEFLFYNAAGAFLWAIGLTVLGYALGSAIPDVDRYLIPIVIAIVIVSSLPPLWHLWRESRITSHEARIKNHEP